MIARLLVILLLVAAVLVGLAQVVAGVFPGTSRSAAISKTVSRVMISMTSPNGKIERQETSTQLQFYSLV